MKIEMEKTVPFHGVDQHLALYPRLLLTYFQEAVGIHVSMAREDPLALLKQGRAWILSKIGLSVRRWPHLGDRLNITTWHTGEKGFKAFREFEVRCQGELLLSAKSMWLFIDLNKKKILRIPQATSAAYTIEPATAPGPDMDTWTPDTKFSAQQQFTMGTRPSDYDPLGHVNNALYFDFLGTLIARAFPGAHRLEQILLQYVKEIPMGAEKLTMDLAKNKDTHLFRLRSDSSVHAAGSFILGL